jgi:Fibronectin type III domain
MSEPTVSAATGPPKKAKKKILGLPVPVVIGGAAALAALGYIWWRDRHKTGAASSSSTTSASSSTEQAQLNAIEAELAELSGQGAVSSSAGTGTGGGGGVNPGGPIASTSTGTVATSTSTSTATSTKTAKNPVSNLHITDTGYTSLTGSWDKAANATSYLITVLHGGAVLKTQHSVGTTARVGNLKRKTQYEYRVRAQPGGKGGSDAHVDVTTK